MERLNSFPLKLAIPSIVVSILLILYLSYLAADTAKNNATNLIFDKLVSAVYTRIVYDQTGNTDLNNVVLAVTSQISCEQLGRETVDLESITVCDDGSLHIFIPTLDEISPNIYSGLQSISVWDGERNLIQAYPPLDAETEDLFRRNQRKILDWRLGTENIDFPNSYTYRSSPEDESISLLNKDVIYGVPIFNADKSELIGSVILQISPSTPNDRWLAASTFLLLILPFFLILSVIGSSLVAQQIRKRIVGVQGVTTKWATGDFTPRIQDRSGDEIGRLSRDLNVMAGQLEELIDAKSILASVQTRQKLARDLHDAAKQQLFAATMQLSAADSLLHTAPESAQTHLTHARELTKQAQQELSAVINELRPVQLESETFETAVSKLVTEFSRQQGIPIQLTQTLVRPIPTEKEQGLFRILQEGLSNVAKHSHASTADVELVSAPDQISLIISDNGRGFDSNQEKTGFGLQSMQERAQHLGGSYQLDSSENGTILQVTIAQTYSKN